MEILRYEFVFGNIFGLLKKNEMKFVFFLIFGCLYYYVFFNFYSYCYYCGGIYYDIFIILYKFGYLVFKIEFKNN